MTVVYCKEHSKFPMQRVSYKNGIGFTCRVCDECIFFPSPLPSNRKYTILEGAPFTIEQLYGRAKNS